MTTRYGLVRVPVASPAYPEGLRRYLGPRAPVALTTLGSVDVLRQRMVALVCSVRCPGSVVTQTYELVRALRDAGVTLIGGFHSPMERECLDLLLRGGQPVIVCPARSIERIRPPADWKAPLANGRLLVLSPFEAGRRRASADLAQSRNELVAALADEVLIAYAEPGGKTEALARTVLGWGKPVLTPDSSYNTALIALGAAAIGADQIARRWPDQEPAAAARPLLAER
ncbi:MAG TPA: DNA-processing protein DprA [Chloroflexota bacterium]|nr:DNA-processing protein DprA [Chloroflexota bacterium]